MYNTRAILSISSHDEVTAHMLHAIDVASDMLEMVIEEDAPVEVFLILHERVMEACDELDYRARLYLGIDRFEQG